MIVHLYHSFTCSFVCNSEVTKQNQENLRVHSVLLFYNEHRKKVNHNYPILNKLLRCNRIYMNFVDRKHEIIFNKGEMCTKNGTLEFR